MGGTLGQMGSSVQQWRLTLTGGIDVAALIILMAGILTAVIWTWRTLDPSHGLSRRMVLTAIRAVALSLTLALLMQPALHFRQLKDTESEIAVLIDVSDSMMRGDPDSRISRFEKLLRRTQSKLNELERNNKLSWFAFADKLVPLDKPDSMFADLGISRSRTDIKKAVTELVEKYGDKRLTSVVVVSDGADTELVEPQNGVWDLEWAVDLGVPINTVFMSNTRERRDLAIEQAEVDSFAFTRSETPIAVQLSSVGLPDREVEAFLWQDGSVVQRRTVQLVGGQGQFAFRVFPSTLGQHVLTVTVPVPEADEVPENNTAHVSFEVIRDKFRVLHLAGRPSWDQRFLRSALKSWPRVDLVSFYVLRTAYQSNTFGSGGMSLIPFPTEDLFEGHLNEFDVIIFHDFEPAAVAVDKYLEKISNFVKKGGALVVIGGQRGLSGGSLAASTLSEVLPVRLLGPETPEDRLYDDSQYRLRLGENGINHPLAQLAPTAGKNQELWRSLTRLDGLGRVAALAPNAHRIAEHPSIRLVDGPAPVIAVKEAGLGRTMIIATDSLWNWSFVGPMGGGPPEVYHQFWKKSISWLTRAPELDRLRVTVDPSTVLLHAPIHINVELFDELYKPRPGVPIQYEFNWMDANGTEQTRSFKSLLDDQGRYRREWLPEAEGPHRVTVSGPDGISETTRFLVDTARKELGHLEPRVAVLKELSQETGGYHEIDTINPDRWRKSNTSSQQILSHAEYPLWDHPFSIGLLIALLIAEWALRRRMGLS